MKRDRFKVLMIMGVLLLVPALSFAASTSTLDTSVTLNGPTGVNPVALRVAGTGLNPSDWDPTPQTSLNFDPLTLFTFDNPNGAPFKTFLPNHFYSIDMAYTYEQGATITQISFQFTSTEPAGQPVGHGLGVKGTATMVRKHLVDGVEATETDADRINKVLLRDVSTVGVPLTTLAGGWLRVYVGLVTKDPALPAGDVELTTEAEVFSPGDIPGSYTGTLTVMSL
jgi:hypothetical protein